MSTSIIVLLTAWLGLNGAFVAMRFYATSERHSPTKADAIGYPTLVDNQLSPLRSSPRSRA